MYLFIPKEGVTMKRNTLLKILCTTIPLLLSGWGNAAGLLKPVNSGLADLEIREHHVDVLIEDGYVTTSVEQTFYNPSVNDLEAIYSFPVPESAAVGEFTYWIDGKPVIGEVVEKKQARKIYEEEKAAGRKAAIVEKDEYKTFDISVYPARAQSDVKIRLVYVQAAHVDTGVGRYLYPLEEGGVDDAKLSFWSRNETVTEKFSFNLRFRSSYPIDALRLPNHPGALIQQVAVDEWTVALVNQTETRQTETNHREPKQAEIIQEGNEGVENEVGSNVTASVRQNVFSLSEDILVYWRHKEGLPATLDLVTHKPDASSRGTFMLTLTPGGELGKITQGSDWAFVLDISGSMNGKYATLVEGVRQGLGQLRQDDRFKVVLFNNATVDLSGGFLPATPANVSTVLQQLESYKVGGGTNLHRGLVEGLRGLDDDRATGVILVTDGVANVGETGKKAFLKLLQNNDVRLFTFIMGNSANRPLLNEMTDVSQGFAISVSNADDIVGQIQLATSKLTHQAFRHVALSIDGVKVKDMTPETIGSLYRGEQLSVFGHYWKPGQAEVVLTAKVGGLDKEYKTLVEFPDVSHLNPELERLWAFASIEQLQARLDYFGQDADVEQAISDIAVEYGLVTDYTSMIVLEEARFKQRNIARHNKQRVETEQVARAARQTSVVQNHRVDTNKPMFNSHRPVNSGGSNTGGSGSGGAGAVKPSWLVLIVALMLISSARRKHQQAS
jgi:Ca-activated chloride channel family protein